MLKELVNKLIIKKQKYKENNLAEESQEEKRYYKNLQLIMKL